jgi:hypothetical protein
MSYSYKTAAPLKRLNSPKSGPASDAAADSRPEAVAEDLLPRNLLGHLADVTAVGPWGHYRKGKAQSIANAMGYEAPFAVRRPGVNLLLNSGLGGLLGAGAGAGLGALSGDGNTAATLGLLGGTLGANAGGLKSMYDSHRGMSDVKQQLIEHLHNKEKLNPLRPNLNQVLTGSGSMDAGQVDAYAAMKHGKKIKPRTVGGTVGEAAGMALSNATLGMPLLPSLGNRLYAHDRLREDDAMQEKTSAFLYKFAVKQASLLTLDSFLTKVAAALPMSKRAAFRTMQAELSGGNTLSHAIKVAFPRLSGEQRGALAVNFCKCAADAEKKTRTFESYAVPVKEGNKLMREKCSAMGEGGPRRLLGNENLMPPEVPASGPSVPSMSAHAQAFNNAPENMIPTPESMAAARSNLQSQQTLDRAPKPLPKFPDEPGKFDLSSLLNQAGTYAKDPRVLGGLAAGGLGAYGLSRLLRRKKPRPGTV